MSEISKYEELLGARPPSLLYHYTSHKSFMSILESGLIWSTEVGYFVDAGEFFDSMKFVLEYTRSLENEWTDDKKSFLLLVDEYLDLRFEEPPPFYVTCFSVDGNSLDFWRNYCPDESGYSFGLNWNENSNNDLIVGRCVYSDQDKKDIILDRLNYYYELSDETVNTFSQKMISKNLYALTPILKSSDIPRKKALLFAMNFARYSIFFKNKVFKNENEWRIVLYGATNNIKFRSSNYLIIPYQEINLVENGILSLPEIWIGPTRYPQLSSSSLRKYIESLNFSADTHNNNRSFQIQCKDIMTSQIPIRRI